MKNIFHLLASSLFISCLVPQSRAVPAVAGDLILGITATGGMGSDTCLEVNLGPASDFYGSAAGTSIVLTKLAAADIAETYGNEWHMRSDLLWGVAGTTGAATINGVPPRTIWASRAQDIAGVSSVPWPRNVLFTLQTPSNTISTMYTGAPGSIDRFAATTNSATTSKVIAAEPGSWAIQEAFSPGVSFRYFNPSVMKAINTFSASPSIYDGTSYTVLDLWEVRTGTAGLPATLVGGIGINNAGKLVFSTDITKFGSSVPVELGQPSISYNANNTVTVGLTGVPAGTYNLERSTTMAAAGWSTILVPQVPSAGTLTFVDTSPPQPRGFYRIKEAP